MKQIKCSNNNWVAKTLVKYKKINTDPDGTIHMTSPLEFWNLNEKFAFNGIVSFLSATYFPWAHL